MARHSFVRMSKLPNVRGRVDYISNPKRQEHLYATYSTVESEFWEYLSEQAQHDFWKSNQPGGKCIEARELIIALPECLQEVDPDLLLKLFTEKFREEYGVQCTAALHHNKTKTNYHIHLIFADRDMLEKTEVKYATRNMFYDEQGRHVRTKREVLGEDGKIRPGCRMLPKGEPYEIKWFSGRKDIFKSKTFLAEVKVMYTDLINHFVIREEDKLKVFDPKGPYLAMKKIGKNNPIEDVIRTDNEVKKEWNRVVDQVLVAGATIEEVTEFKREEVTEKISLSIRENGHDPGKIAAIILNAIDVLKAFLKFLMERYEPEYKEPIIHSVDVMKVENEKHKGPRPDSQKEELEYRRTEIVYKKLDKANRKIYALQKQRVSFQEALDSTPKGLLHRKERKALQNRIDGLDHQIEQAQRQFEAIPVQNGFENVKAVKQAFQNAKATLREVQRKQAEWDGIELPTESKLITQPQKTSIRKKLAENKIKISETQHTRKKSHQMEL